jgi:hypothetical protein
MTYNQDGSEYYQLAEAFAAKFEEKYFQVQCPGLMCITILLLCMHAA